MAPSGHHDAVLVIDERVAITTGVPPVRRDRTAADRRDGRVRCGPCLLGVVDRGRPCRLHRPARLRRVVALVHDPRARSSIRARERRRVNRQETRHIARREQREREDRSRDAHTAQGPLHPPSLRPRRLAARTHVTALRAASARAARKARPPALPAIPSSTPGVVGEETAGAAGRARKPSDNHLLRVRHDLPGACGAERAALASPRGAVLSPFGGGLLRRDDLLPRQRILQRRGQRDGRDLGSAGLARSRLSSPGRLAPLPRVVDTPRPRHGSSALSCPAVSPAQLSSSFPGGEPETRPRLDSSNGSARRDTNRSSARLEPSAC